MLLAPWMVVFGLRAVPRARLAASATAAVAGPAWACVAPALAKPPVPGVREGLPTKPSPSA